MAVPHPGPPRRLAVPRRAPVRAPQRRTSSSAGRWLALLGLLAVAGSVAGGVWFLKTRTASPALSPSAASLLAPPSGVAEPAEPSLAAVSPEQVQQAVAEAPLLTPAAARALLTEAARHGQAPGQALDRALYIASVGFADLDRATLDELGELFARSWSARPARDQGRIQAYMQFARSGEPLSPEAVTVGRTLFVESVRALPAASQARLTAAFGKAVVTGIAHQQQAEERAGLAALAPPPPPAESPSPAPADNSPQSAQARAHASRWPTTSESSLVEGRASGGSSPGYNPDDRGSSGRGETYWRSRAAGARSAIESAEKRVRDLEAQATRGGPFVPGPLPPACQAGVTWGAAGLTPVHLRDESRNAVTCNSEIQRQQAAQNTQSQLDAARQSLARAQKALEALEDEARRDGALPGWLR